ADIERIERVFGIKERIDDLEFLTSLESNAKIEGIKFKFPELNPYARRSIIFDKLKRLKIGKEVLLRRLKEAKDEQKENGDTLILPKIVSPVWAKSKKRQEVSAQVDEKGYRIFHFPGFQVGVGKNAKGNDSLRNEWAKKTDYWFHLDAT